MKKWFFYTLFLCIFIRPSFAQIQRARNHYVFQENQENSFDLNINCRRLRGFTMVLNDSQSVKFSNNTRYVYIDNIPFGKYVFLIKRDKVWPYKDTVNYAIEVESNKAEIVEVELPNPRYKTIIQIGRIYGYVLGVYGAMAIVAIVLYATF